MTLLLTVEAKQLYKTRVSLAYYAAYKLRVMRFVASPSRVHSFSAFIYIYRQLKRRSYSLLNYTCTVYVLYYTDVISCT